MPVDIAADGRHRGLQFVRDIGDKFLPPPLGRFERIDHRVERAGEIVDLARIFRRFLDAHAEFTPAKAARGASAIWPSGRTCIRDRNDAASIDTIRTAIAT